MGVRVIPAYQPTVYFPDITDLITIANLPIQALIRTCKLIGEANLPDARQDRQLGHHLKSVLNPWIVRVDLHVDVQRNNQP